MSRKESTITASQTKLHNSHVIINRHMRRKAREKTIKGRQTKVRSGHDMIL